MDNFVCAYMSVFFLSKCLKNHFNHFMKNLFIIENLQK